MVYDPIFLTILYGNPWKRVSEQVKLPSSSDHWFDQIVVLEKIEFNSPMCDDKVLVSEVNSEPSTSLCIRPSVKSFVLLYGFSVPFTLTLKVWKG